MKKKERENTMKIETMLYHDEDSSGGYCAIAMDGKIVCQTGITESLESPDGFYDQDDLDERTREFTGARMIPVLLGIVFRKGQISDPSETVTVEQCETRSIHEYRAWLVQH